LVCKHFLKLFFPSQIIYFLAYKDTIVAPYTPQCFRTCEKKKPLHKEETTWSVQICLSSRARAETLVHAQSVIYRNSSHGIHHAPVHQEPLIFCSTTCN